MSSKDIWVKMPSRPRLVDLRGGRHIPPPLPGDIRPQSPRRSPLKTKRRRLRAVVSASVCVCALLCGYAAHVASYSYRLTYQNVSVVGTKTVSSSAIQNFVENKLQQSSHGFISGRNIFVYDFAPLSNDIDANFPTIKDARVTRDTSLGNGLVVTVEERTPYARWCEESTETTCFLLDEEGVIFASALGIASTSLPTAYVFNGPLSTSTLTVTTTPYGEVFGNGHFPGMNSLLKSLQDSGVTPLGARIENDTDFSVPLAEGFYLKASYGEDPELLGKNLNLILNSDALKGKQSSLEYVDLRFGNRVYYKFKGAVEVKPQS